MRGRHQMRHRLPSGIAHELAELQRLLHQRQCFVMPLKHAQHVGKHLHLVRQRRRVRPIHALLQRQRLAQQSCTLLVTAFSLINHAHPVQGVNALQRLLRRIRDGLRIAGAHFLQQPAGTGRPVLRCSSVPCVATAQRSSHAREDATAHGRRIPHQMHNRLRRAAAKCLIKRRLGVERSRREHCRLRVADQTQRIDAPQLVECPLIGPADRRIRVLPPGGEKVATPRAAPNKHRPAVDARVCLHVRLRAGNQISAWMLAPQRHHVKCVVHHNCVRIHPKDIGERRPGGQQRPDELHLAVSRIIRRRLRLHVAVCYICVAFGSSPQSIHQRGWCSILQNLVCASAKHETRAREQARTLCKRPLRAHPLFA